MRRIIAVLLAFLLTGSLVLFGLCFTGRQAVLPLMNGNSALSGTSLLREEKQLVRERVEALADLYHFEAEPVIAVITDDVLLDLNQQASDWWSTLLRNAETGEMPSWNTEELELALASDKRLAAMEDRERAAYLSDAAVRSVHDSVVRLVLPLRQQTVRLGMQEASKRVDILNVLAFFLDVPWTLLALCALLAGLLALLGRRGSGDAMMFTGSALGAAALVMVALVVLCLCAGIQPMIREASAGLAVQYRSVVSGAVTCSGLIVLAMAAGCVLLLLRSRRNGAKA